MGSSPVMPNGVENSDVMSQSKTIKKIRQKKWMRRPYRFDRHRIERFFKKYEDEHENDSR